MSDQQRLEELEKNFLALQPRVAKSNIEKQVIRLVDEFLFNAKRGFCEHFASSFAVLMRAAGVPGRSE